MNSFTERRIAREAAIESESIDPATKCVCVCGQVHYRKKLVEMKQNPPDVNGPEAKRRYADAER